MIATCTQCGKMFQTTQEDAGDPFCLCVRCYNLVYDHNQSNEEEEGEGDDSNYDANDGTEGSG